VTTNIYESARPLSYRLWVAGVWLWILPGVLEYGLWFILVFGLFVCPRVESVPDWRSAILMMAGASFAAALTAIRQRLHPVVDRCFRGLAIVTGVDAACMAGDAVLTPRGIRIRGSWAETLYDVLRLSMSGLGNVAIMPSAFVSGFRKRNRAVPRLILALTSGDNTARRKAIVVLGEIEQWDQGAARKGAMTWRRRPQRRVCASESPSTLADAVPAIQVALQDDDLFARTQAAKVRQRMGVEVGRGKGDATNAARHDD